MQKFVKNEPIKNLKKHRCIHCGTQTHNPKGVCVLCETGITKLYKELKELCGREANGSQKQKAVKVAAV